MSIEFIGMIGPKKVSEIHPAQGPALDPDYIARFAQAHEQSGFDRILIAQHSSDADPFLVTSHAAAATKKIGFMLAHRPGFIAPTMAARKFATLDQLSGGRLAVHIISGGDDEEQQRDGDFLSHDERYARTDEYLGILRKVWTNDQPFDHAGKYYRFKNSYSEVRTVQKPHIPIYFGGASPPAVQVAGKHADVYALWGETHEQVRDIIRQVSAEAEKHGRKPRFSVSFRPILADTEEAAWARAESILAETRRIRKASGLSSASGDSKQSEGARRLLATAERGDRHDRCLWTAIAKEIGGRSNSTALVGTPEQVAHALLDYVDLGVSTFLIRGFDPLEDAIDYGRKLIPLTRQLVAARSADRIAQRKQK
ncbi:LLM class flavin-dependent oxidoreductase [Glaciimonas sp. CA11.2]|uniref:LLM class flavin-dependent oxidoreductase n=1 Tax=unclassified Glaciimonas TaxID=2644401 RepID=UPI002AB57BF9|nr:MULTISPECIES: LLM class flavin-dependent oxidoreductase [unclassified Glaciimonas]MDY7546540.1 LLM class flavin-dependent oxidoreductase [Glaciimonas sp. CA11.2]MEB0012930.1 LLM class flavin-dependent oxidoreductase [Glaciimonas sp. Cout2]MEB0080778.1 LLM class flavin-dependent oxidoreductase [Glaciimonas sp. Gout2]MEB0163138.1 LLM class flavin-dependent oxidoreductase [Glaciimonas sp. CA11.2]